MLKILTFIRLLFCFFWKNCVQKLSCSGASQRFSQLNSLKFQLFGTLEYVFRSLKPNNYRISMILSSLCLSACYGKIVSENYHALAHPNAVQCFSRLNSLDRARDKFLLLIDVRLSSSRLYSQFYRVTQIV